ncbi:hypothetical protein N7481_006443 [Penicillium waksmanii]|uniref:uncharacterized protein n=1 Tax=Penicillium waksmanii TaxID=69791 RepID=UPI0025496AD8|nr:uncharacterized protein N7481_006443 [Penicillium waksmanii]KAJ5984344.1 hypothetical protein N7481_006443 [Penicillium waksmanii]
MSTPNDLQALLASIRPRPSPPNAPGQEHIHQQRSQQPYPPGMFPPHPQHPPHPPPPYDGPSYPHPHPQVHGYHHPQVASAMHSPSPLNTPPHHGSDIISPNVPSPYPEWAQQPPPPQHQHQQQQQQQPQPNNPDRAANLLNLLRFSQGSGAVPQPAAPAPAPEQARYPPAQEVTSPHGRNISASDFVASMFGRPDAAAAPAAPIAAPLVTQLDDESEAPEEPRGHYVNMLMDMLGAGPKAPATEETQSVSPQAQAVTTEPLIQETADSTVEFEESSPEQAAQPETVAASASNNSIFTYSNPFDQLAAISPRNKSPQPPSGGETPAAEVVEKTTVHVTANLGAGEASEPAQQPKKKRNQEPVLEPEQRQAVNDVVGRLVDEIGRSLSASEAQPSSEPETVSSPTEEETTQEVLSSIASNLRETAPEAKEAADSDDSIKEAAAVATAAAATATVLLNGNGNIDALADSWESAEDSAEKEEERIVSVHNFPLKPFISINVKPQSGKFAVFRDDGIMDIARLKKDFDQLDRSLTAATSEYIVYALAKTGGIRIIRQDDGSDRQVFRSTRDRVFNVTLCTSPPTTGSSDVQAILGIGVSGTVYWALISRHAKDLFELDALESESLIFPPFPASDENTSGGQLKTRAKRSTRHPDLFAIGRGKNIYVVSPQAAMNASYSVTGSQRTVNTEKFFKERALKISTGKAGKDFAFSEDDTVIASLDKTGRLRFWDIRDFLASASVVEGPAPNEIRVPLNTFVTGSPAEKSWPTSVLFLDKLRAYSRSMALRYVLVGLKQNHTLQLWDIGLGKAVEELKFPHENESDAICSVAYHPSSGIIVVGHPTRNSIYFVHLSAPRYNLSPMSQATYIKAIAEKDSTLPKPDSTACLSGIREISLGSKGQLRSLELLPVTKSATDKRGHEETGLFELYVMHSRGVTCLNIKKEDLGWTSDNKVIRPVDGLEEGTIEITELQSFPSYVTDDPSVNGDAASIPSRTSKEPTKKTDLVDSAAGVIASRNASPTKTQKKEQAENVPVPVSAPAPNGAEKAEKVDKKKKKKSVSASSAISEATVKAKEPTATVGVEHLPTDNSHSSGITSTSSMAPFSLDKHLENLQSTVSQQFNQSLGREMEGVMSRFDEERRSWDAASSAKQDQVLRLVSSTLSDNVEKNLARIVSESIKNDVLPAVTDATSAAVGKQLNTVVSQQLGSSLSHELRHTLPKVVTSALQHPHVMKAVSDSVGQQLGPLIGSEINKALQSSLLPVIEDMARGTKKLESDMERHFQSQIKHLEAQRRNDQVKMDEMSAMLRSLSSTVNTLVANQGQAQVRQNEHPTPLSQLARLPPVAHVAAPPVPTQPPVQAQAKAPTPAPAVPTPEQAELAEITRMFGANKVEEASIKWIQSSQQADLFDNFFIRVNPQFLTSLSAIVMLSIGVAVTSSLSTNVGPRLGWLNVVLTNVNPMDNDLREITPNIMNILGQRLNNLYMAVAERNPQDPILRMIAPLSRRTRELHSI